VSIETLSSGGVELKKMAWVDRSACQKLEYDKTHRLFAVFWVLEATEVGALDSAGQGPMQLNLSQHHDTWTYDIARYTVTTRSRRVC
jgi:hypothetical protein